MSIYKVEKPSFTGRGFEIIEAQIHDGCEGETEKFQRLIQESSAVGDHQPGDSYLWIGDKHHLEREQVRDLANRMINWCDNGTFHTDEELEELQSS